VNIELMANRAQVIVNASSNELLCSGYNSQLEIGDPTEHGEINAIRVGAAYLPARVVTGPCHVVVAVAS
jgi:tRNA(Arg) A34 adenosine deaminase TadA